MLSFLAIAAGCAFYVLVAVVAIPREITAMWVLAGYTFVAGVGSLAVAVALLLTRQLPMAEEATLEGVPAVGVRAWRARWLQALIPAGRRRGGAYAG